MIRGLETRVMHTAKKSEWDHVHSGPLPHLPPERKKNSVVVFLRDFLFFFASTSHFCDMMKLYVYFSFCAQSLLRGSRKRQGRVESILQRKVSMENYEKLLRHFLFRKKRRKSRAKINCQHLPTPRKIFQHAAKKKLRYFSCLFIFIVVNSFFFFATFLLLIPQIFVLFDRKLFLLVLYSFLLLFRGIEYVVSK